MLCVSPVTEIDKSPSAFKDARWMFCTDLPETEYVTAAPDGLFKFASISAAISPLKLPSLSTNTSIGGNQSQSISVSISAASSPVSNTLNLITACAVSIRASAVPASNVHSALTISRVSCVTPSSSFQRKSVPLSSIRVRSALPASVTKPAGRGCSKDSFASIGFFRY